MTGAKHNQEDKKHQVPFLIMYLVFIMGPIGLIFVMSRMWGGGDKPLQPVASDTSAKPSLPPEPEAPPPPETENLSFLERLRRKVKFTASTWRGSGGEVSYSSQTRAERIKLKELSLEKQGITYEPYVAMMVLEQFDRTYDSSIGGALDASFGEDLEGARSVLQDALLSLDPKHLIGRQRLLKALQDLEVSANNPEEAIRINETMEEATLEIAKAYARGQEQAGKFTATQAAAYVKAHEGARDTNSAFLKLQLGLTGPDPNNGLQRVSGIIDTAAGAAQRGDEPRPNEPEKSMTQDSQEGDADRGDETGSLN